MSVCMCIYVYIMHIHIYSEILFYWDIQENAQILIYLHAYLHIYTYTHVYGIINMFKKILKKKLAKLWNFYNIVIGISKMKEAQKF